MLKVDTAVKYLEQRGGADKKYAKAIELLKSAKGDKSPLQYKGSSGVGKNRDDFGKIINEILDGMSEQQRLDSVRIFDNDLMGSQGLHHIAKKHPEVFVEAGIMERGNFSAAAGFGYVKGKQGIYSTFCAFLEMCISEITMSRLNFANVLAHFTHSGVDDMADNTCHFGINSMFADGGVKPGHGEDTTRLYFPCDQHQFAACVKRIYNDPGLRFLFSTRSAVPDILDESGKPMFQGKAFEPGKDDLIRDANGGGYVVACRRMRLSRARCGDPLAGAGREGRPGQQIDAQHLRRSDDEKTSRVPVCARRRRLERQDRPGISLRLRASEARLQRQVQQPRHQPRRQRRAVATDAVSGAGFGGDSEGDQGAGVKNRNAIIMTFAIFVAMIVFVGYRLYQGMYGRWGVFGRWRDSRASSCAAREL